MAALLTVFAFAIDGTAHVLISDIARAFLQFRALLSNNAVGAARDLVRPRSGEQILPSKVLDMLVLIRNNDLQTFAISSDIASSLLLLQRITEAAYPRLLRPTSHDLLALVDEALPQGCQMVAVEHEVVLARCN